MNKKYLVILIAILILAVAGYFMLSKSAIDLPTEGLASGEQDVVTNASDQGDELNAPVSVKDRTLQKDGFSIMVPAGWAEVDYMPGATIVANPAEANLDPLLEQSGFRSYYSITREKLNGKTWDQAVSYVRAIVTSAAPGVEYARERDGKLADHTMHYWEANMERDGAAFKVIVYAVRGEGDDLWILTFNTGASMWSAYSRLAHEVFDSLRLL